MKLQAKISSSSSKREKRGFNKNAKVEFPKHASFSFLLLSSNICARI